MRTIREIDIDISKHRKLLNRAVGNHILPVINYHHYHIVELINEREESMRHEMNEFREHIRKSLVHSFVKLQDDSILKGINATNYENPTFKENS